MRFSHFFIDRPIFAAVISILIVLVGSITYFNLPVAQYPEIAPPTITVSATYPGAGADVVADTVATPIEQELNGVENMLYLSSQATDDGRLTITVTFALGTDLDAAQVLVQNRVAIAEPRLPEEVRRLGVVTQKSSPDLLTVVHLYSPDNSRDQLYISNYALLQIRDTLARLDGVGSITVFGAREYSMRIWLDPDKMATLRITATDVLNALRAQNVQVASGILGQPPVAMETANQISVRTQGRLQSPDEFAEIVVKTDPQGGLTRVRDIARVELGAQDYRPTPIWTRTQRWRSRSFSGPDRTRWRPPRASRRPWRGCPRIFPRAWPIGSSTTRPNSSPNRCRRSTRRSSRRRSWSRWSSSSSCRAGAPR